ncbi:DUF4240 domain-containing protein (plasmid) [Pseudoalteromonas sp. T1lg65]|uniref:DUF4240 domain-containing protein n=1 Tax=Pseudoalteromonas sp. T1lg65 TaxID=2077101 RepID=UPI003F7B1E39
MELSTFWQLVTLAPEYEDKSQQLKLRLSQLTTQEIADFDTLYIQQLRALWHWDVWKVAYVVAGCNSEYDFLDFCNWLISSGESAVNAIKVQPDTFDDCVIEIPIKDQLPYPYVDELDLVAGLLYEEMSGEELPYHSVVNFPPQGKKFKNKPKQLRLDLPRLFERYWLG